MRALHLHAAAAPSDPLASTRCSSKPAASARRRFCVPLQSGHGNQQGARGCGRSAAARCRRHNRRCPEGRCRTARCGARCGARPRCPAGWCVLRRPGSRRAQASFAGSPRCPGRPPPKLLLTPADHGPRQRGLGYRRVPKVAGGFGDALSPSGELLLAPAPGHRAEHGGEQRKHQCAGRDIRAAFAACGFAFPRLSAAAPRSTWRCPSAAPCPASPRPQPGLDCRGCSSRAVRSRSTWLPPRSAACRWRRRFAARCSDPSGVGGSGRRRRRCRCRCYPASWCRWLRTPPTILMHRPRACRCRRS